jgi:hypothetical protein
MSCRPGDLSVGRAHCAPEGLWWTGGWCRLAFVWVEPLVVDPDAHAEELARFGSNVVCGPGADDCAIWVGAIGADGCGLNRSLGRLSHNTT